MAAKAAQPRTIPIDQLSLQDLSGISKQMEQVKLNVGNIKSNKLNYTMKYLQELSFFGESLQELREVQAKFNSSKEAVSRLGKEENNTEAMVPLSESVSCKIH